MEPVSSLKITDNHSSSYSRWRRLGMTVCLMATLSLTGVLLTGCGTSDEEEVIKSEPVDVLYNRGHEALMKGDYEEAMEAFTEVERQHPYSEWAVRAQVMNAYAAYENEDYVDAIAILERYVKMHPSSESTPYAYYLMALCYYDQISDVRRDQGYTEKALTALEEVMKRFPDTDYARDARIKRDLTVDHLAGKEMEVGRYYLKRGEYLSAINRFQYVVENFETTAHTPEALHRLVESYLSLGVRDEAQKNAAVLGYNYPDSLWYRESYQLLTGKELRKGEEVPFWKQWLPFSGSSEKEKTAEK
jgi:outer membrane protein assembly factor BamD